MSVGKWVAQNLSLGGLFRHAGAAAGTVTKTALHVAGAVAEVVAETAGSENPQTLREGFKKAGELADDGLTATGKGLGYVADKTTEYACKAAGGVAAGVAELAGADDNTVATAKKIGTVAGAAAVGLVAGAGVADAAVAMAAAPGTAGAAATTSGLAALGGGSIAAGGGGMAAGQAVTQGIVAAGAAVGIAGKPDENDT